MEAPSGTCFEFEPQKWRKSKCKHCFQNIELHVAFSSEAGNFHSKIDNGENKCKTGCTDSDLSSEQHQGYLNEEIDQEVSRITKTIKYERIQVGDTLECGDSVMKKAKIDIVSLPSANETITAEQRERVHNRQMSCSFEEDSPCLRRKYSYETECLLTRSSCMEFSSTSSLASFDALEDNTLSSYSYGGSRDNLDGFASGDELCFQEKHVEKSMQIAAEKQPADYKEEIDGLQDQLKYLERDKDRVTQALERELDGLKLQLATYSARENITIVKNRLELEGKNQVIQELEEENGHLRGAVEDLRCNRDSEETQYDWLQGEVKRRNRRLQCLEDEKKTLEERLKLAEDLQRNDRDLLDVLRNQLTSLERDLLSAEDKNKQLEKDARGLRSIENELKEEKQIALKLKGHVEFLNGKLKVREQHVSYLEEDNVNMQQEKLDLETKLEKDREKIERLHSVVKELKKEVKECHGVIEKLNEENGVLEQAHWQVVINQSDASGELESYIKDLEKKASQGDGRIRELEAENESLISQSSDLLENLVLSQNEVEESKRQFDVISERYSRLQSVKTDQEKRMMTMQRKLKKLQKEKKRFQIDKQEMEEKISSLKLNDDKVSSKCHEIEKGYKMLQLKLQSTEAKLTMVERNKIYIETKLKEYENKNQLNNDKVMRLDGVISNYLRSVGRCSDVEAGADAMESFEVNITKVVDISKKLDSQLRECNEKNDYLVKVVEFGEARIEKINEYLEVARKEKNILKYLLEEKTVDCEKVHDAFMTSIASLGNQNDFLEGKLSELRTLECAIRSYEERLDSAFGDDVGQAEDAFGKACNVDDSGIESSSCQNEAPHEEQSAGINPGTELGGFLSAENDNIERHCCSQQQPNCGFILDEKKALLQPTAHTLENCAMDSELVNSLSTSSEDALMCNHEEYLFDWCKEDDAHDSENCLPTYVNDEMMGLVSCKNDSENTLEPGDSQCLSDAEYNWLGETNRFDEENANRISAKMLIGQNENKGGKDEEECFELIPVRQGGEDKGKFVGAENPIENDESQIIANVKEIEASGKMDGSRPYTSIKCIFQVETDDKASQLDYSEKLVRKGIFSEGRKEKQHHDSHGSFYSIAASDVGLTPIPLESTSPLEMEVTSPLEMEATGPPNMEATHPLQTTAVKGPNGGRTKSGSSAARSAKSCIGQLYQISQEGSGAITLTIPSSNLDDDDVKTDAGSRAVHSQSGD